MPKLEITNDLIFKIVFGSDTPESAIARHGLLEAMIKKEIRDVKLINPELLPLYPKDKDVFSDMVVTFNDGETSSVEMQVRHLPGDNKRFTYSLSRLHSTQKLRKEDYTQIKSAYLLLFTCYDVKKSDEYYHQVTYRFEDGSIYDDTPQILIGEIGKMKDVILTKEDIKDLRDDEALLYFLKHCSNEEKRDKIEMIKEGRGFISMAQKLYNGISEERHEELRKLSIEMAKERMKAEAYYEGFAEGKLEMMVTLLPSLLEKMPLEEAALLLKIPVEKAKELIEME